jgi:hypothetical protein
MTLKKFKYLILSVLLFSCSNTEQNNDIPDGSFSVDEAKELANLLNSSVDSSNIGIVEKTTIGTEQSYSDSIWKLVTRDLTNCQSPNIKKIDNKNWSYCKHNNDFDLYKVEYVADNIRFTEKYLLKNKQLIYAVEWEKRPDDVADDEATWWNCEYIIRDDHVVDHMSLGMGKTEDESFNLQDIITLWNARKVGFSKLKIYC